MRRVVIEMPGFILINALALLFRCKQLLPAGKRGILKYTYCGKRVLMTLSMKSGYKIIAGILLFVLPLLVLAGETQKHLYKVVVDAGYAPYEFRDVDGRIKGLLPDMLRAIGKSTGTEFKFIVMNRQDAVTALNQGKVDLFNMIRTQQRINKYAFSNPFVIITQALFRNKRHAEIDGISKMGGNILALQRRDIAIKKLTDWDDFNRIIVGSEGEGFDKLNTGKVAAFFTAEKPGLYFIKEHDLKHVELAASGLWPQAFCFVARKNNTAIIQLLNGGLAALKRSGEYDEIIYKWQAKPENWIIRHYDKIVIIGIVLLAVMMTLWLWVVVLRRTVSKRTADLRASKTRLSTLLEQSPIGLALSRLDGSLVEVNSAYAQILGRSIDETLHLARWDITPEAYVKDEQRQIDSLNQTGHYGPYEKEYIHKNGHRIPVRLNGILVEQDGEPMIWASIEDITEISRANSLHNLRRRLMEILLSSRSSLKEVLEQFVLTVEAEIPGLMGSVLLMDAEGQHLLSGAAPNLPEGYNAAIHGVAIGDGVGSCGTAAFLGKRVIVSDIATDPLWEDYRQLALEYQLVACWSEPVVSGAGDVLGTFAMYYQHPRSPELFELDIIELAAELTAIAIEREQSEVQVTRLLSIIETSSDFIGMLDAGGCVMYINPAGLQMLGWPAGYDVHNMKIDDFHSAVEIERLQSKVFPAVLKHGSYQTGITFLTRDGDEIPTLAAFSVQRYPDGSAENYAIIAHDVRKEREQQQRMEHTQRLESLGVLAGGIAHDFNNILTAILGNAALAERKVKSNPEEAPKYLANIAASSEKAAELCRQMLAYSGQGQFTVKPVDLSVMVEEITKLLEVSIARSVILKYQLVKQLPAVEADVAQIQQVIMNLVINASDAIGEKSGVISIATGVMHADHAYLEHTCLQEDVPEGRYIFLEVSDTGSGMDKPTQQRIFEPFFTTKFTGRGLGMSVVLGIIRRHHGTMKLYSELGRGTTFKMLLPISDQPAECIEERASDEAQGTGTILIIDDEETIRETAVMMLEDKGFTTMTAVDGLDGVEVYRQHRDEIAAVLLDITMPKLGGEGCFMELRRINSNVRVVLSSGYNEQEATSHFSGKGLTGFIQKPYRPEALVEIVRAAAMNDT